MSSMAIALLILAVTIVLFIWEPVPIIVTAIGASIAYAYTGIISVDDIFKGYNSTTIVLLAGMMVLGSSLFHTGITDVIGQKMIKITGKSERNIILATLVVSCALSAICSNIGVMTAMAPLVTAMCLPAGAAVRSAVRRFRNSGRSRLQRLGSQRYERAGIRTLWIFQHYPFWNRRVHSGNAVFSASRNKAAS